MLKSRGMAHSNQMREFVITDKGIDLVDVYVGPRGRAHRRGPAAAGSPGEGRGPGRQEATGAPPAARWTQAPGVEAQVAALQAEITGEEEELQALLNQEAGKLRLAAQEQEQLAVQRKADPCGPGQEPK